MLYIFHVDTGTMLQVEMNLALEDCLKLKEALKRTTGIPVEKQVLLASGGEGLEDKARVCSYSAGTDTNPIYLYSLEAIEHPNPPVATADRVPNADLKEEVDASLNLPATIGTVTIRCQLAQQILEKARQLSRICERLVHDQHLQQQGWAAVIANLEDVTTDFRNRSEAFENNYTQYLDTRQNYLQMLESFSSDIAQLSRIPLLPGLLESLEGGEVKDGPPEDEDDQPQEVEEVEEEVKMEKSTSSEHRPSKTLLQWISEKDSQYSVDVVAKECRKGLEQFNESILEALKAEIKATIEGASKSEYREIKGLEDRLYGLDQLKIETGKLLQEQNDLAQAFHLNQLRANNVGDTSILPDLCTSHRRQLVVMLKNHNQLRDIKRRCIKAKQELVVNLHHRLKWVTFIESKISEMEMRVMMYNESLKRLRRQLSVLQQLHHASSTYVRAVAEVVRRRAFSEAFLLWANDLACQLSAIHAEEMARRKAFHSQFDGHFLSALFPGLEDTPPPFATEAPPPFDDSLPKLSLEDIDQLKAELPDLALSMSIPDTSSVTQFFLSRTAAISKPPDIAASIEDRIVEAVAAAGLGGNLEPVLLQPTDSSQSVATTTQPISSDKGFESETDTEEFEKVGQSPTDATVKLTPQESIMKLELFSRMERINSVVGETMSELKTDVGQLKQWILCERTELECLVNQLLEAWSAQNEALKREVEEKEEGLMRLAERQLEMEMELRMCCEERDKAREALEVERRQRREEAARLAVERALQRSTPVSPGQPRQTVRSISESILGSFKVEVKCGDDEPLRRTAEEEPAQEATTRERRKHSGEKSHKKSSGQHSSSRRQATRSISESQLGSLEVLKKVGQSIDKEFFQDLPADSKIDSELIRVLERTADKSLMYKSDVPKYSVSSSPKLVQNVSPSSSIVTIESNTSSLRDAATSPEPSPRKSRVSKEKLSESTNSLILQGKISVGSCNEGDVVLVIWDENCGAYTILQESSSYTFFLHLDSLCSLGLRAHPRRQYVIGEVVNKEYCQAKKPENRYNVPVGSRFYRVRVRPLTSAAPRQHPLVTSTGVQSS